MKNVILSYKTTVVIRPKWAKIFRWFMPNLDTDAKIDDYIKRLDKKYKIDAGSLYGKIFSLLDIHDGVSGLSLYWSFADKEIIDNLSVSGELLSDRAGTLTEEFERDLTTETADPFIKLNYIAIAPTGLRLGGQRITNFPYEELKLFFMRIQQETGHANYHIKKFPRAFQDIFDQEDIYYSPIVDVDNGGKNLLADGEINCEWLQNTGTQIYSQRVSEHLFESTYYTISLIINFFAPNINDTAELDRWLIQREEQLTDLAKKVRLTEEEKKESDEIAQEAVNALRKIE